MDGRGPGKALEDLRDRGVPVDIGAVLLAGPVGDVEVAWASRNHVRQDVTGAAAGCHGHGGAPPCEVGVRPDVLHRGAVVVGIRM